MEGNIPQSFEIDEIIQEIQTLDKHFLSVGEVAVILRIAYISVWRRVVVGDLAASKIGGTWRISRQALLAYLQNRHPFNIDESGKHRVKEGRA